MDDCHCELVNSGVYRLTYIKTADIDDSNGDIYIRWPGTRDLILGKSHLPEVRGMLGSLLNISVLLGFVIYKILISHEIKKSLIVN